MSYYNNGGGGGGGNSGGMMMVLLIGGICCCSLMSSGGLGAAYFLHDGFKAWVDRIFGRGDEAIVKEFLDKGCRWNHTVLDKTKPSPWGCHNPAFPYRTTIKKDPQPNRADIPMGEGSTARLYDVLCTNTEECQTLINKTKEKKP